jgi:hypothetical protein
MPFILPSLREALSRFIRPVLMALICVLAAAFASAQSTSATDGSTPLALSPGAPAGSFHLSGFESVNPYNGNLSFHLPLLGIGGRGGAGMTSTLALDSKSWTVRHVEVTDPNTGEPIEVYTPVPNPAVPKAGYGIGGLMGRQSGQELMQLRFVRFPEED